MQDRKKNQFPEMKREPKAVSVSTGTETVAGLVTEGEKKLLD